MVLRIVSKRMRTFERVASLNSFTTASYELNMSQPAVTFQIRSLEEEIGEKVFFRTGSVIKLTRTGKVLLDWINESIEIEKNAAADLSAMLKEEDLEEKWQIAKFAPNPVAKQKGWWWWDGERKTESDLVEMGLKIVDNCWMQKIDS